ncbi:MAG: HRDC domain-containing protein [Elusimicrobia bacterium]|nr:HRDC domain-containing protein [Elusimicrobiota bacterium]
METEDHPVAVIETLADLEQLAAHFEGMDRISVDLESDSFYSYHEKVCLLQVSSATDDFVIDPLSVLDLSPLGAIFRDPKVEKIFHAGEYDILCLKRDYGFEVNNVFDTMIAARILGSKELGLASLIQKYFDVTLSKKLQRSDWGKRPLTAAQIEYARLDTHYLSELRDILHGELTKRDLDGDADDEFARLVRVQPTERVFDPDSFWRLPGARAISAQQRAVLKELYYYREKTAAQMDRAAFRVLPEQLLVRLAEVLPRDLDGLQKTRGMTPYLFNRFGKELLDIIEAGLAKAPIEKEPERPANRRWDTVTMHRYEALRQWRKKKAEDRGVDTVVILATDDLREIAQAPLRNPHDAESWLSTLSERKRELYGEELLALLSTPVSAPVGGGRKRRRRRRSGGGNGTAAPPADA